MANSGSSLCVMTNHTTPKTRFCRFSMKVLHGGRVWPELAAALVTPAKLTCKATNYWSKLSIAKKKTEAKSANTADAKRQKGEYYGVLKCVQQGAGPEDRGGGVRCACLG